MCTYFISLVTAVLLLPVSPAAGLCSWLVGEQHSSHNTPMTFSRSIRPPVRRPSLPICNLVGERQVLPSLLDVNKKSLCVRRNGQSVSVFVSQMHREDRENIDANDSISGLTCKTIVGFCFPHGA